MRVVVVRAVSVISPDCRLAFVKSSLSIRCFKTALVAFLILISQTGLCALSWPRVSFPPNAQVSLVAEEMEVNGVKMKTWSFKTWLDLPAAMEFYRDMWQSPAGSDSPGFVEYEVGEWVVISRMEGEFQITVQFRKSATNTAEGLVGISELARLRKNRTLASRFPRFGNMKIVNEIKAVDHSKSSKTIIALTDSSIAHSVKLLRSEFARKGWTEQTALTDPAGMDEFALIFQKRSSELNVSLVRDGAVTGIVAVFVNY